MTARVVIVHLGSASAWGGRARVASLRAIFEAAGADVDDVPLLVDHRAEWRDLARSGAVAVARGRTVPESLAWSRRSATARLAELAPDVIVCVTARAYDPTFLEGSATVVLDYVDRLSDSYRDRARIVGRSVWAPAFQVLARTARRFEQHPLPPGVMGIAAGWLDAQSLGLTWVPITFPPEPAIDDDAATFDLLFLGKLSYPPNVEAIRRLARLWPEIIGRRPSASLLLAGASPDAEVHALAASCGWGMAADFDELADIIGQVRLGVVPLLHASGIQTKVLASAAFGLPQVVDRTAAAGFRDGFPVRVAAGDDDFVQAVIDLLDDDGERRRLGAAARAHMASTYAASAWTDWAAGVLGATVVDGAP